MEQEKTVLSRGLAFLKQATIWTIILMVMVLAFLGLYVYFFFELFGAIQDGLLRNFGIDGFIAKGIVALIMAIMFYFPTGRLLRSFLPLPQKNKGSYRAIVFIILAIIFFSAHFFAPDIYFDRETGKSLKFYSIGSDGEYRFYSTGGFDPITGDSLKPVTKDIITKYREEQKKNKSKNKISQNLSGNKDKDSDWFSKGVVVNKTQETIFFYASKKAKSNIIDTDFNSGYRIPPRDTIFISLEEGTHAFAIFDVDGKYISYSECVGAKKESHYGYARIGSDYYSYAYIYLIKVLTKEWSLVFDDHHLEFKN